MSGHSYGHNLREDSKLCSSCGQWKPFNQFSPSKTGAGRLKGKCIACEGRSIPLSKEKSREYMIKHRYGLSMEQLNALWESKGKSCHICGTPITLDQVHIDHCHESGSVRGALCHQCNVGIGMFKDDPNCSPKLLITWPRINNCKKYLTNQMNPLEFNPWNK